MPNWVTNRVSISGKHADVDAALAKLVNAEGMVDFNLAIPMPETLSIEKGTNTEMGIWLLTGESRYGNYSDFAHRAVGHMLVKATEGKIETLAADDVAGMTAVKEQLELLVGINAGQKLPRERLLELLQNEQCVQDGRKYLENLRLYGFGDWYDWSVVMWGTKWNASRSQPVVFTAVRKNTKRAWLVFETAWSSPDPVLRKVAELVPGALIRNRWQDEGGPKGVDVFRAVEELADPRPVGAQPITGTIFEAMAGGLPAGEMPVLVGHVTEDELVDALRKAASA